MDEQLEIYNQSVQASLDKLRTQFQEFSKDFLGSDLVKGIIDVATIILKILDELVKHIGGLGTVITTLGLAKIVTTMYAGAKSASHLTTATVAFLNALKGGAGGVGAFNKLLGEMTGAASGATTALGGVLKTIGGIIAAHPVGLIVGATAVAAGIAYKQYKKQQEELHKQATQTTENWGGTKSDVDDYAKRYAELNEQLNKANLTESERIGIKQQILDLQNEISEKYGRDISNLDLINGKFETQLGLISKIKEEEAHRNLQDNKEAYDQAVNEMTGKQRQYTMYNNAPSQYLQNRLRSIYESANFKDTGDNQFVFSGNALQADEDIRKLIDSLEKLKSVSTDVEKDFLDGVINNAQDWLTKNNKILEENQSNYKAYLEQSLFDKGFGDELSEYSRRVQEYNEALLSGDMDEIAKKRAEKLEYFNNEVSNIFDDPKNSEFQQFFDSIDEQVDISTEKIIDWKDIVEDETTYANNKFNQSADEIRRTVDDIKKIGLDGVDIQAILGGADFQNPLYDELESLARLFDEGIDLGDDTSLKAFTDFLEQVGILSTDASGGVDLAKSSFEDFLKMASSTIDTIDKATAALVNSFGSRGLSMGIDKETGAITGDVAAIIQAYKDLDGYDPKVLFERTADGINVNTEALRALQSEQEAITKKEFLKRIAEAQKQLNEAGTVEAQQYWQEQLDTVRLLSTAYDGATSSYQKWIDAQKMTSPGSKYDQIATNALKQAKEYYDEGLVGNPVFQSIAQLFTNEDLSLATTDEIVEAYENGVGTVEKFFTEGSEGAKAFADKLVELNLAEKEGENYDFSEHGINTAELANELGISVDLVEAAFGKLKEYGWTINFISDDQLTQLGTLSEKAELAKQKLAELADEEGQVGGVDMSSVIDIDVSGIDTIEECDEAIQQITDAKAKADVDSAEYEYLDTLLEDITLMREVLEQPTKPQVDDSDLISIQETEDKIIERINAINLMNAAPGVHFDIDNDEEFRELAQQLLDLDDEEVDAYFNIKGADTVDDVVEKLKEKYNVQATVTADASGVQTPTTQTMNIEYQQGDLPTLPSQVVHIDYDPTTVELGVTAKLDSTEVDKYNPKDLERTVTFHKKSSEVDNYSPPNFDRSVNYTINVSGKSALDALPDDGDVRNVTVKVKTEQLYTGTVSKSAFQGMSHARGTIGGKSHASGLLGKVGLKSNENALINELGPEIVVRPSEDSWMIFNDGKPTFASLKKDDVIFNADLSRQLLQNGKADDYAKLLGGSYAGGTVRGYAHVTKVKGGGHFGGGNSTTKDKDKGGGGGGGDNGSKGSNNNSTKEAKEFSEILDEIEIKIDRIERSIKNLDTVASNAFNSMNVRQNALSSEIAQTTKEIDIQKRGYVRYMKEADKYGSKLNADLRRRIANGEIDIQEFKNEDNWKNIEQYKKWWKSRHLIHLIAGKPLRHINYNIVMKYAQV